MELGDVEFARLAATLEVAHPDGFADPDGTPVAGMPTTRVQVQLSERDGGTRMVLRSIFDSRDHMDQVVNIGAPEVLRESVGQMDALLAA